MKYDINESPVFVLLIHFSRNADSSNITHMQRAIISVFVCLVPLLPPRRLPPGLPHCYVFISD